MTNPEPVPLSETSSATCCEVEVMVTGAVAEMLPEVADKVAVPALWPCRLTDWPEMVSVATEGSLSVQTTGKFAIEAPEAS